MPLVIYWTVIVYLGVAMDEKDMRSTLEGITDIPVHDDEDVVEHYRERGYEQISYHGRPVYLFTHERDFGDRRHTVSFHGADAPFTPEHIYQYVIVKYALRGEWEIIVDGERVRLREGDCLVTDRFVPQAIPRTGPKMLGVSLILNEEFFQTELVARPTEGRSTFEHELTSIGEVHEEYRHYPTAGDPFVKNMVETAMLERLDPTVISSRTVDALIAALLAHLLDTYEKSRGIESVTAHSKLMGEIRDWVARNYRTGRLADMADQLGYQRTYLCRVIRETTGATFKQMVNAERMKHAMMLLQGGEMPAYQIAEQVGISNLTVFYRRFREWTGSTPQQWRDR